MHGPLLRRLWNWKLWTCLWSLPFPTFWRTLGLAWDTTAFKQDREAHLIW